MVRSRASIGLMVLASACAIGCPELRLSGIVDKMNKPGGGSVGAETPKEVDATERIARLVRDQLADSYIEKSDVTRWMGELAKDPGPLVELTRCLGNAKKNPRDCYVAFRKQVIDTPRWTMPAPPSSVLGYKDGSGEIDAERFLANVYSLAPSLVTLEQVVHQTFTDADFATAIQKGTDDARAYVSARKWRRDMSRPTNAIVLSGGAANGAFNAGSIWVLMTILDACRNKDATVGGCGDARIDLVAGTSTGALIASLIDAYFAKKGMEKDQAKIQANARAMLVENYTCRTNGELYCRNSDWTWNLFCDVKGLVHFDGLERILRTSLKVDEMENDTELVTMSLDFQSGDLYATSDQDPADLMPLVAGPDPTRERFDGKIQATLAAVVEPLMSDPVDWLPGKQGRIPGTFMDAGMRSGLPVMQAALRGAERVAVFATSGLDPTRDARQSNAFAMVMRMLDLNITQPKIGEPQQAEFYAQTRRMAEYNICRERFAPLLDAPETPKEAEPKVRSFCMRSRTDSGGTGTEAAATPWVGPTRIEQVATSWQTSWVFKPEVAVAGASGYSFQPAGMRELFKLGVRVFQERCTELTHLLSIRGSIAEAACKKTPDEVVDAAVKEWKPLAECEAKERKRSCN